MMTNSLNNSIVVSNVETEEVDLFTLAASTVISSDPNRVFRLIKATSDSKLNWDAPGAEGFKEIPHLDILGLRGVVLSIGGGFILYNSESRQTICTTVAIHPNRGRSVEGSYPMPALPYSPVKYGTTNTPDPMVDLFNPQGSRMKSCAECVKAGENVNTYVDSKGQQQVNECSLSTNILFYVKELGIAKQKLRERKTEIVWTPITEILDEESNALFTKPIIVRISISRAMATSNIRAGSNKMQVPTIATGGYVPEDYTGLSGFRTKLFKSGLAQSDKVRNILYTPIVEMYSAQPLEAYRANMSQMTAAVPVFSLCKDKEKVAHTRTWLEEAWRLYDQELEGSPSELNELISLSTPDSTLESTPTSSEAIPSNNPVTEDPKDVASQIFGRGLPF